MAIRNASNEPTTDRPHQKADGKDAGSVQQLSGRIGFGKKCGRKVNCAECVDVEIKPLDHAAAGGAAGEVVAVEANAVAGVENFWRPKRHRRAVDGCIRLRRRSADLFARTINLLNYPDLITKEILKGFKGY